MFDPDQIKGILLDYGGTIDSNGTHWSEVIWEAYQTLQIPVDKDLFRQAYIHGERTLATHRMVLPHHNFRHVLRLKAELQMQWLHDSRQLAAGDRAPHLAARIADLCYTFARSSVSVARPILKSLSERYPLVLVTNFYGNIQTVLEDFSLNEFFDAVVESSAAGVRKPDPGIFQLGIDQTGFAPRELVAVGDSYDKDILPSSTLGCHTVWLKKSGWNPYRGDETADAVITSITELNDIFHL
ncbi:MAG: HAD family hydrolase [Tannerellaceae bacterium]|jgi:putative hydrolase of the HAD superfamily|nr:HAD family hydrolase [Tannerellaceae bacterium]